MPLESATVVDRVTYFREMVLECFSEASALKYFAINYLDLHTEDNYFSLLQVVTVNHTSLQEESDVEFATFDDEETPRQLEKILKRIRDCDTFES